MHSNNSCVSTSLSWWLLAWQLAMYWLSTGASTQNTTTLFCPCLNQGSLTFSLLMHFGESTTTGALLRAAVRQAARDRGVDLHEFFPTKAFDVTAAIHFLDEEARGGTSGIIMTAYTDQFLTSIVAANAAGIPIYFVGGGNPDLIASFQKRESPTGPIRASLRYVGPDEASAAATLAARLVATGATHFDCISTAVGSDTWHSRCQMVIDAFKAAGFSAHWLPVENATSYVADIMRLHPGETVGVVVEETSLYRRVRAAIPASSPANIVLAVYETSVGTMADIRSGKHVLAVDLGVYTQGYMAMALAFAERHTGQMVTSDVVTGFEIYGKISQQVTDAIMQREVCRAAGNPVCGDPGVVPVTPTGCACFNRSEVRHKVVGSYPKRDDASYYMYQGMKDVERDMPGSTFNWNVYPETDYAAQIRELQEVTNGTFYKGAISLDAYTADLDPALTAAMRAVSASGKPLYLGFLQTPAANIQQLLDQYKARAFFGGNPYVAGYHLGKYMALIGRRNVLANNAIGFVTYSWGLMRGLMTGYLGDSFVFPPNIWDFPPRNQGSPDARTGVWALFTSTRNTTVQVMNGVPPVSGGAFLAPLRERLEGQQARPPLSDVLVLMAADSFIGPATLNLLANLSDYHPDREPVALLTYMCSSVEMLALLRRGLVANEELLLGCVDEQTYLSTFVAANVAALEQQTSERVVGEVRTERLLRADQLPLNFARRVACELANLNHGVLNGIMGIFYPLCDVRQGCTPGGMSAPKGTVPCSGHGKCMFPTQADPGDLHTDGSVGQCECREGWAGQFCSQDVGNRDKEQDHKWRVLLGVLLSCGLASVLLCVGGLYWWHTRRLSKREDVERLQALLRKRQPPAKDAVVAAVVMDVSGLPELSAWDPAATKRALGIYQRVVRALLPHYHGYETGTSEGSFSVVFHDPVDALGWAIHLQRSLQYPLSVLEDSHAPHGGPLTLLRRRRQSTDLAPSDWSPALLEQDATQEVHCGREGAVLFRGLRVRMGIHVGVPDVHIITSEGNQLYKGDVMDLATAIRDAASGGQVLMSMQAWRSLGVHVTSIVCHHMGMHQLSKQLAPIHLMQVLPKEMAERAPFPALKSVRQLSASFFDAPASECFVAGEPPRDPVVIAFMYVASAKILRKTRGYRGGVDLLVEFVQKRLAEFEAYEVEEKDGNFLLAFRSAGMAVQFAETIQRGSMGLPWSKELLEEELAAEVVKPPMLEKDVASTEQVVFRGLRLQIGMCMEVPSDCQPHMATGRAAYFGPVVNRAARIAATAAPGQTLVNQLCFEAAKGHAGSVQFTTLGKFDLKGVKEPMHLFQVSSPALNSRLFPRTLKLAKMAEPVMAFKATTSREGEPQLPSELAQSISPNARNMRRSVSRNYGMGRPPATGDASAARTPLSSRTYAFLTSLRSPKSRTSFESTEGATTRALNKGRRASVCESEEFEFHAKLEEISYDALVKLAVRQHAEIGALRLMLQHVTSGANLRK